MNNHMMLLWGKALLMFARIIMVFVQAPIWGAQHFKDHIRIGIALGIVFMFFPYVEIPEDFPTNIQGFMFAILTQLGVGAIIGWVSFLTMATAQFGGELLDIQMGLSAAAQNDPASHGSVNLIRRLYFYLAMMLYLLMDGHQVLWKSIYASFQLVPVTYFRLEQMQFDQLVDLGADLYLLGMQMASPAVGALFVAQVALGMVAKAAPQMNVFMISFPMNLSIGIFLLTACLPWLLGVYKRQFEINNDQVNRAIQMMAPPRVRGAPPAGFQPGTAPMRPSPGHP